MSGLGISDILTSVVVLVMSITVHEFAHAYSADRLGDPTPRSQGRITLNPWAHLDPMGTVMMVAASVMGIGIGWGKPVMIDRRYFRFPLRDDAIVSVAGPASNLVMAAIAAMAFRGLGMVGGEVASGLFERFLLYAILVNLSLAFFNLIPIRPLDGSWIVSAMLPPGPRVQYEIFMQRYGPICFFSLIFFGRGILAVLISVPSAYVLHWLMTVHL